jgi:phosphatidylserine/phosphatidylglycerophosphate/cardiolipin synthase-like enzyme
MTRERRSVWGPGLIFVAIVGILAVGLWIRPTQAFGPKPKPAAKTVEAVFSPGGGCADRIIEEINGAEKSIRVQAYFFTSKPISNALIAAHKRGVKVRVIMDGSQKKGKWNRWRVMRRDGVTIYFDDEHAVANNKIILIDRDTIITGSYNYTKAAEEKNAENILIIKNDKALFSQYLENYETHQEHSSKNTG